MKRSSFLRKVFRIAGPGFVTGASDDDPSGIATYAQTGAMFGYTQLWTALFSFPLMTTIQEMCGRVGMVTGKGLSAVIKRHYGRSVLAGAVLLLLIANIVNIGANLGAMASAAQLLFGLPFIWWLGIGTVGTILLQIFVPYKVYARYLKYLALSLLAYIGAAFMIKQDWTAIGWATILPSISISKVYLMNIVAILGTTISPYLFFWQASEEVEEEVANNKLRTMGVGIPAIHRKDIATMRLDTFLGMLFSNVVMFFIIITAASTLHTNGISTVSTAAEAATMLKPFAGELGYILFALGIIGTGLLAVPILAGSASYAVSEALGWPVGLYRVYSRAKGFYAIIAIATAVGLVVNFVGIPPFRMLYYTAILNGICAPPLLILILLITNNKNIMGAYHNTKISNVLGIFLTVVMSAAAVALLLT